MSTVQPCWPSTNQIEESVVMVPTAWKDQETPPFVVR
jgi:hypothetical protein